MHSIESASIAIAKRNLAGNRTFWSSACYWHPKPAHNFVLPTHKRAQYLSFYTEKPIRCFLLTLPIAQCLLSTAGYVGHNELATWSSSAPCCMSLLPTTTICLYCLKCLSRSIYWQNWPRAGDKAKAQKWQRRPEQHRQLCWFMERTQTPQ